MMEWTEGSDKWLNVNLDGWIVYFAQPGCQDIWLMEDPSFTGATFKELGFEYIKKD